MLPNSYPKVLSLGHRYLNNLLMGDYIVEEKIDGSQISFGVFDGELHIRSKGAQLYTNNPDGMFRQGVEFLSSIKDKLTPDWTYRGEYLQKPKHNCLAYDRVPKNHIIIFDIEMGEGNPIIDCGVKASEADAIGLESTPFITDQITGSESIKELLQTDSCLGGQKIEGVVIKNYNQIFPDGKYMVGKYVSEAFKERQGGEWRKANPTKKDAVSDIILCLKTDARYNKAVQHLREKGKLTDSPQDIGNLLKEIHLDIEAEEEDYIKNILYKHAIGGIKRGVCGGFPEWYKQKLLENMDA